MLLHIGLLVKPFSAVLAWIGPGVRMDEQVSGESAGSFEGLPTLLALEYFLHAVDGPKGKGWGKSTGIRNMLHKILNI